MPAGCGLASVVMRLAIGLVLLIAACVPTTEGVTPGKAPPSGSPTSSGMPAGSDSASAPAGTAPGEVVTSTSPPHTSSMIPVISGAEEFPVPGSRPHDVAVTDQGTVWYTAQNSGSVDRLDPATGQVTQVPLGSGAAPHGVIVGPEGDAWVTEQGRNALVRVDNDTLEVTMYPVDVDVSMHTATFAPDGRLWFTGQRGYVGRFDPSTERTDLFETDGGGPYGITATPDGDVYFAALAGSYIARVDAASGDITRIDPGIPEQGARRVWSDSNGLIWVSYWNTGHLARYDPGDGSWTEWRLPGEAPQAYAVYVDETDRPWVSDFGGDHALLRFDPATEVFESVPLPTPRGEVRQLLGRPGEVWGAESAVDALVVVRYDT